MSTGENDMGKEPFQTKKMVVRGEESGERERERVGGGGGGEDGEEGFDECFSKNKINGLVNGEPGISLSVRKRISCFFKIALSWVKYILHRINRYCVEYAPQKLSVILIFYSWKVHLQSDNRIT
jgi:hypothetical protein